MTLGNFSELKISVFCSHIIFTTSNIIFLYKYFQILSNYPYKVVCHLRTFRKGKKPILNNKKVTHTWLWTMNFPLLSHYEVGNEYSCQPFIDKKTNSSTSTSALQQKQESNPSLCESSFLWYPFLCFLWPQQPQELKFREDKSLPERVRIILQVRVEVLSWLSPRKG